MFLFMSMEKPAGAVEFSPKWDWAGQCPVTQSGSNGTCRIYLRPGRGALWVLLHTDAGHFTPLSTK